MSSGQLDRGLTILGILGGVTTLATLVDPGIQAVQHHQWVVVTTYALLLVFLFYIAVALIGSSRPKPPGATTIFTPFIDIQSLAAWPRADLTKPLMERLDSSDNTLILIVGTSGAGKTVMLRRQLPEALQGYGPINLEYIDQYQSIMPDLENVLVRCPHGAGAATTIVILDQFEQFLASLRDLNAATANSLKEWFRSTIVESSLNLDVRYIVAVRREWYYDLRFLDDLVPSPIDCMDVPGLPTPTGDVAKSTVIGRFMQLTDLDQAVGILAQLNRDGTLLPVEVQIVGATLERLHSEGSVITSDYLQDMGGAEGAVDRFFDELLEGAPDRIVALKVLLALAIRTRFRRREDLPTILESLFEAPNLVRDALDYLRSQGLIVDRGHAQFELAHDYLADYFHNRSGSELDPVDRDNILFHIELDQRARKTPLVLLREEREERQREDRFGLYCLLPLYALMILRWAGFGIKWPLPWGPIGVHYVIGDVADINYLPILIAHASWATYIWQLYERILANVRSDAKGRMASRAVLLNMVVCVVISMFIPELWLTLIGWGGFVLAVRLITISRRRDLNKLAARRLWDIGSKTATNLLIVVVAGAGGAVLTFADIHTTREATYWTLASTLMSMILTYAAFTLFPLHAGRAAASRLLGLIARSRSGVVRTPEV